MRETRTFSKQVSAAIGEPGFIATVRKKLNLERREAADIFGGGVDARHGNGKTKPSLAFAYSDAPADRPSVPVKTTPIKDAHASTCGSGR